METSRCDGKFQAVRQTGRIHDSEHSKTAGTKDNAQSRKSSPSLNTNPACLYIWLVVRSLFIRDLQRGLARTVIAPSFESFDVSSRTYMPSRTKLSFVMMYVY